LLGSALIACLLSAGVGCEGDDRDGAVGAPEAAVLRVVLGTGEAEFEPMEGEPQLTLVAGVQGGFHAWASLLAYGFRAERPEMQLETVVEDDPASRLVMRARLTLRDTIDADGNPARAFAGFPAQVADARCANGKRVSVHVTLIEPAGGSAEDSRAYFAELDPSQRRDNCE
jgi:hypothetical protein